MWHPQDFLYRINYSLLIVDRIRTVESYIQPYDSKEPYPGVVWVNCTVLGAQIRLWNGVSLYYKGFE